jgi:serine/threonine protein kinase
VTSHPHKLYDALPLEAKLRLDQVCRAFEAAWHGEPPPEIEPFLHGVPRNERMAFVQELVLLDLEYRRSAGFTCQVEEYSARFPELDRHWLLDAWAGETVEKKAGSPDASREGNAGKFWVSPESGTDASLDRFPVSGLVAEEYEILEPLGRGGMGVVYRARQSRLNRLVAVKVILAGEHASEASLKRFRIEAQAAARMQHDGFVQVYDAGEHAGRPYLVMEYVEGGSLKDRLDGTPWPCRQAAEFVARLATIMHAAHEKQILHRDLKPANILFTRSDQVKVTDFGLAKLVDAAGAFTQSGEVLGTPSYMAPEQARGQIKEALPAIDIYALGAILYELLTGRPPFRGTTATETLLQVIGDKPAPPSLLNSRVSRDLETVCLKCLEKEPGERYDSAAALAEDLGRYLDNRSILARPPGWTDALLRSLSHRQWVAPTTWGKISLVFGFVGLAFQLLVQWLVLTQQPKEVWWLTVGILWLLLGSTFAHYLGPRFRQLTPPEGHLLAWSGGNLLGTGVLWVALGTPTDEWLLTAFYPAVAVLLGVGYFVQASLFWGRFYLLGLAFFALAIVMQLTPRWAPLEVGLLYGLGHGFFGWYVLREPEGQG